MVHFDFFFSMKKRACGARREPPPTARIASCVALAWASHASESEMLFGWVMCEEEDGDDERGSEFGWRLKFTLRAEGFA